MTALSRRSQHLTFLDDVVPRVVATVGDTQGILPHSMTGALRNRDPESLTPYEAVLDFRNRCRKKLTRCLCAATRHADPRSPLLNPLGVRETCGDLPLR